MQIRIGSRSGLVSLLACLLFLASCAPPEAVTPPPPAAVTPPVATAVPPKQPLDHPLRITVKPGQSLGRIAEQYHVPKRSIIAANQLQPPYELKAGSHLVIPGAAAKAASVEPLRKVTATASTVHATHAKPPAASTPQVIPLD